MPLSAHKYFLDIQSVLFLSDVAVYDVGMYT